MTAYAVGRRSTRPSDHTVPQTRDIALMFPLVKKPPAAVDRSLDMAAMSAEPEQGPAPIIRERQAKEAEERKLRN
jgi:hypothetical protein